MRGSDAVINARSGNRQPGLASAAGRTDYATAARRTLHTQARSLGAAGRCAAGRISAQIHAARDCELAPPAVWWIYGPLSRIGSTPWSAATSRPTRYRGRRPRSNTPQPVQRSPQGAALVDDASRISQANKVRTGLAECVAPRSWLQGFDGTVPPDRAGHLSAPGDARRVRPIGHQGCRRPTRAREGPGDQRNRDEAGPVKRSLSADLG